MSPRRPREPKGSQKQTSETANIKAESNNRIYTSLFVEQLSVSMIAKVLINGSLKTQNKDENHFLKFIFEKILMDGEEIVYQPDKEYQETAAQKKRIQEMKVIPDIQKKNKYLTETEQNNEKLESNRLQNIMQAQTNLMITKQIIYFKPFVKDIFAKYFNIIISRENKLT